MKLKLASVAYIALCAAPTLSWSAPNPASQDWVFKQITLTGADWNAVCTTGAARDAGGCLGNIGSSAFQKVNRILRGVNALANVPISDVPNSVFIQKFNGDSEEFLDRSNKNIDVYNNSDNNAVCGIFTEQGENIAQIGGMMNFDNTDHSSPKGAAALVSIESGDSETKNLQYEQINSSDDHYIPVVEPFYLLCMGFSVPSLSTAQKDKPIEAPHAAPIEGIEYCSGGKKASPGAVSAC